MPNTRKWAIFSLFFCISLAAVTLFLHEAEAAISTPTAEPPGDNTPTYLNIGDENQGKIGPLRLGTSDTSTPYDYQLEVLGAGALLSSGTADLSIAVNQTSDTFYIDPTSHRLCIGSCLEVLGSRLEINDGTFDIQGGIHTGLAAVSQDAPALYGNGGDYGIEGFGSGAGNAGIYGFSTNSTAVSGSSTTFASSAIAGFTTTGYGIYATNTNSLGRWAGYFQGRLESSLAASGSKFLARRPSQSLVPYTAGQVVAIYPIGDVQVHTFDGTNIWVTQGSTLYKIRTSDGFIELEKDIGTDVTDVMYNLRNVWVTQAGTTDKVKKLDTFTGATECSTTVYDPQAIVFDGESYWVSGSTADGANGVIVKLNESCAIQNTNTVVTSDPVQLGRLLFTGKRLWAIAHDTDTGEGVVIAENPSRRLSTDSGNRCYDNAATCQNAASYIVNLINNNPADILYDNYYFWVTSTIGQTGQIERFYPAATKICAAAHPDTGQEVACTVDDDCLDVDSHNLGGCFQKPQDMGAYHTGQSAGAVIFDGTYLWITNPAEQKLVRLLAADPSQEGICESSVCSGGLSGNACSADYDCNTNHRTDFSLGFTPTGMVFDGTYLWLSSGTGVTQIYAGTGYGTTDLSSTITLQSKPTLTQQQGQILLNGSGKVGDGLSTSGDVSADTNIWGDEADTVIDVSDGTANCGGTANCFNCPDGYYITNIIDDGSGVVSQIVCRPL